MRGRRKDLAHLVLMSCSLFGLTDILYQTQRGTIACLWSRRVPVAVRWCRALVRDIRGAKLQVHPCNLSPRLVCRNTGYLSLCRVCSAAVELAIIGGRINEPHFEDHQDLSEQQRLRTMRLRARLRTRRLATLIDVWSSRHRI